MKLTGHYNDCYWTTISCTKLKYLLLFPVKRKRSNFSDFPDPETNQFRPKKKSEHETRLNGKNRSIKRSASESELSLIDLLRSCFEMNWNVFLRYSLAHPSIILSLFVLFVVARLCIINAFKCSNFGLPPYHWHIVFVTPILVASLFNPIRTRAYWLS